MSESEEKRIAELEKELMAAQQLLYHVLTAVNEPVVVTREDLSRGVVEDTMIDVSLNEQEETFVISIKKISESLNEQ